MRWPPPTPGASGLKRWVRRTLFEGPNDPANPHPSFGQIGLWREQFITKAPKGRGLAGERQPSAFAAVMIARAQIRSIGRLEMARTSTARKQKRKTKAKTPKLVRRKAMAARSVARNSTARKQKRKIKAKAPKVVRRRAMAARIGCTRHEAACS